MVETIEFRLIGQPSADGELLAIDAVNLIDSFRVLAYRLTRSVAERPGLGRTAASLEQLSKVRVALRPGSTRVVFSVGDEQALDVPDAISVGVRRGFWGIVRGISENRRPDDVTDTVADSVGQLVGAITKAARETEITVIGHTSLTIRSAEVARDPWESHSDRGDETTVHGTLEMVDLRSSRFRIRDAARNGVDLHEVTNPAEAAPLVGTEVAATGRLVRGREAAHHRMDRAVIVAEPLHAGHLWPKGPSLEALLNETQTGTTPPALNIDLHEIDEFLTGIDA